AVVAFEQKNGGGRPNGAQLFHECDALSGNVPDDHVSDAVDDGAGSIDLNKKVADGGIHPAIARETEVNDMPVQTAPQDSATSHARTRGTGSLCGRGAAKDERLCPRGQTLEMRSGWNADAEELNAIIKREIEGVLSLARSQIPHDFRLHFLL